jgi:ribonuclease P protein component
MKRLNRILKHQEFDAIIRSSPFIKSQHFVIHFRKNEKKLARIGVLVSKKNGNAVIRNKIKRQIRAIVGAHLDLSKGLDIVIIARTTYDTAKFHDEETELASSLMKIGEKN